MRVGLYYRVSTDTQDLDMQRNAIEDWLKSLPLRPAVVNQYIDKGKSGNDDKRIGFNTMLLEASQGIIDTIVVYKLDRFSRNATTALLKILELDRMGVAFISVSQPVLNLGHDNPFRRTMICAFAEIAQIEREQIVSRVKAGLAAAAKKGRFPGREKAITPEMLELAKKLRLEGLSCRKISWQLKVSRETLHRALMGRGVYAEKKEEVNV